MIQGTPLCNGLVVHSLALQLSPVTIKPLAVFVNTRTGQSHGTTTLTPPQWSADTLAAVETLRQAIERDLSTIHFTDSGSCQPLSAESHEGSIADFFDVDPPSI